MSRENSLLRNQAISFRRQGCTYGEICSRLGKTFPKSTLSYWCKGIILSKEQKEKIEGNVIERIENARIKALSTNREKRLRYLRQVRLRVVHLKSIIKQNDVAKIALAMLYLGEGGKKIKSSLMFGNSDELVIRFFMKFLRQSFRVDENKFRITVQCRADQNVSMLRQYWSSITRVPLSQFYKSQIDPRTVGRPSKKLDYKGVCRIDYLSADVVNEIRAAVDVLN